MGRPNVPVGIASRIVEIQGKSPTIRTVVAVTADNRHETGIQRAVNPVFISF